MARFKVGDIVYFTGEDSNGSYKIIDRTIVLPDNPTYNLENINTGNVVSEIPENLLEPCQLCKTYSEKIIEDVVNYPNHYRTGKFECIEVMQEALGIDAVKNFCLCNAFKYIYRHNRKNGLEDIKKAQWYINKYIELSEE